MNETTRKPKIRPCPLCGGRNVEPDAENPGYHFCVDCMPRVAQ
jgi:endogenous inhibitor of DNA gyrase (YacG/DUF329 family)